MLTQRRADQRGRANLGWLDSRHTFSFGEYYDPDHLGFRALRVINDDRVEPGGGFAPHPHRDMEIISYVLLGALEHRDSMGHGSVIRSGEVQRMTAGTGVVHSEYNPSSEEAVHFLQIWILPERKGLDPGYEQRSFPPDELQGTLRLVASRDGRDASLRVHQDVCLYAARLEPSQSVRHQLGLERHCWVQVARGSVRVNGVCLGQGDGAAIEGESNIEIHGVGSAEVLLFDLA
jgi:redox-sensitive bicupin YhaK (pirin superfamily)